MKTWSRKKRWLLGISASFGLLLLFFIVGTFAIGYFNLFDAHRHCSKALGSAFSDYARAHEGRYPYHTNGFGDALLLLVKEGQLPGPNWITAPGDDGKMFKECLENGLDVPEDGCTRIYIQGLSESNANDNVVMVFDKYPTPGGDHFRRPWGPPTRDVVMSDHWVQFIPEKRWPAFAKEQMDRLSKLGFKRVEIEKLFGMQSQSSR